MDSANRNQQAQALLPDLKEELGDLAKKASDENLLKFLRWKPNVKRAAGRFRTHLEWKKQNPGLFDDSLRIIKDPELERLLQSEVIVHPPGSFTKTGGPVVIGRLRNNDMKDGRTVMGVCRMLLYTIDRILEYPEAQLQGITIIHDLEGFNPLKNAHIEVPKKVFGAIIGNFPIRINRVFFWNAPPVFQPFFTMVSSLVFPKKMKSRFQFIQDISETEAAVDKSVLLTQYGGQNEYDVKKWILEQKEREENDALVTMTSVGNDFVVG